ncbi:uncharacterized protein PGTG_17175 [Puccinia graminis f. sp. tritici CRL 75-36-700-3]|uniref:Uncharacterized protein n=1 Tax=Puccinia graminis f. sp. tritici (strain CRL 75-36-700-3 / race SCCL) TaxID=418459 RepID=E3L443_PUCGT|nr:uncharacterized protein PGTG_17175 [Puccinia graminis f. sp. tritici CRL 75-36-700-3]EFP91318.2 hypothetical protein PGTG_17175 [Puccinia graminis f. sp. tritici CRL 75-36-700-3]
MSGRQDIVPVHGSDGTKQAPKSDQFIELNTVNLQQFEKSLKDLEADVSHIKAKTAPDSIDQSQELFARKLTLLHQFNLFINQQNQSNIHDSSFISTFDQQRLLNKLKELESEISKLQQARYSSNGDDKRENPFKSKPKKFGFKRPAAQFQAPSTSNSNPSEAKPADQMPSPLSNRTTNPFDLNPHSKNLFIRPFSPLQPLHILALSDLSNVVLDLRALFPHLSTLQLSRIHHAAILAPPLSGSTSYEFKNIFTLNTNRNLHYNPLFPDLTVYLEWIQVRTYESEDLVLLLHSSTGPVIERSKRIAIGPYPNDLFPPSCSTAIDPKSASQHHLPNDFDCPESSSTAPSSNFSILSNSPIPLDQLSTVFEPGVDQLTPVDLSLSSSSCFVLPQSAQSLLMNL